MKLGSGCTEISVEHILSQDKKSINLAWTSMVSVSYLKGLALLLILPILSVVCTYLTQAIALRLRRRFAYAYMRKRYSVGENVYE